MKARPGDIDRILDDPPAGVRLILLYGPDAGLVAERARRAVRAVVPDAADPFRISSHGEEQLLADPPRLADDLNAMSLAGGRRVIRIQPAGDRLCALLKPLLETASGDTLMVAVAGELGPRSSLRKLAETAAGALAVACYEDNAAARRALVQEQCRQAGLQLRPDALDHLVENLGADRGVSRQELEKLILYIGPADGGDRSVTLRDARAVVGDSAAWRIDDIADSMLLGDMERLERNFCAALQAGAGGVRILNAASASARRLHALASRVERGDSPASAIAGQRPPVPFFRRDMVAEQLRRWPRRRLDRALAILAGAETDCKTGAGAADISLCRQAMWRIALRASRPPAGGALR